MFVVARSYLIFFLTYEAGFIMFFLLQKTGRTETRCRLKVQKGCTAWTYSSEAIKNTELKYMSDCPERLIIWDIY